MRNQNEVSIENSVKSISTDVMNAFIEARELINDIDVEFMSLYHDSNMPYPHGFYLDNVTRINDLVKSSKDNEEAVAGIKKFTNFLSLTLYCVTH